MKISVRHKKGNLRTRVIRKIEDVSFEAWNKVFPNALEGYQFFKTLDESGFDQFSFCYILVYEGKQLVGAAPCFLMNYPLETSINGYLRRIANIFRKIFPNLFNLKTLVCGIPMSQGQIGMTDQPQMVLAALLRRMEQLARRMHAHLLAFKDLNQSYTTNFDSLKKDGFLKIDSLPSTELAITFPNFEGYLKILSSATRYDFRRKLKKAATVNIERTIESALDNKTLEAVYRLYTQMVKKHEMGFEIMPAEFFKRISQNMPGEVKYFLWRIDGKLVAFLFCLVSDTLFIDYFLGLDYALALKYHLYFVKTHDVINWCITHDIKKYDMGPTGYEPKRRLGFDFVPLYIYVKVRYRWLRPFFKGICGLLRFENFDPELKRWQKTRKL